jgi:hypothetical protein
MKPKLLLLILFILALQDMEAQSYRNDASRKYAASPQSKRKKKERIYKKNIVKFNLTGLMLKSAGFQYERKISRKTSLSLGLIYRPKGAWFLSRFYDTTTASTGYSQETKFMLASSRLRSFSITPEFRYYLGRQAPKGLYLAAFTRFKFNKTQFNYHYYDDVNFEQRIALANLNETMIGGGILFGYQLVTRKQWTVDFWFLGPWIGNQHVKLYSDVNAANINPLQQTFISQDMKDMLGKEHDIQWNRKGILTQFNYFDISARFLGINIAYSF